MWPVASARKIVTVESGMKDNWFTREGKRGMLPVIAQDVAGGSAGWWMLPLKAQDGCLWTRGMLPVKARDVTARDVAGKNVRNYAVGAKVVKDVTGEERGKYVTGTRRKG